MKELYKPSRREYQEAEKMMSDEQSKASREREFSGESVEYEIRNKLKPLVDELIHYFDDGNSYKAEYIARKIVEMGARAATVAGSLSPKDEK